MKRRQTINKSAVRRSCCKRWLSTTKNLLKISEKSGCSIFSEVIKSVERDIFQENFHNFVNYRCILPGFENRILKIQSYNYWKLAVISLQLLGCVAAFLYKELFCILTAHKLKLKQKFSKARGLGVRKGTLAGKPSIMKNLFTHEWTPDWCSMVILIEKCIKFTWMIPGIIWAWHAQ